MSRDDFLWAEKYRPQTVEDCILSESIKTTLQEYVNRKEIPNLILVGSCGTGKTSAAKAMCDQIGCDHLFLNGSSENGIDTFRVKITNYASSVSLSGGKKVIIIDEADFLTPNCFAALRAGIEEFSKNCTFILTGNHKNKFSDAIQSRCAVIDFHVNKTEKKNLLTQFFKRVCNILDMEGVEHDKEAIASFITKWYPDNRKILSELQRYGINGKIDIGILTQVGDLQLKDLINFLKDKDFTKVREWVSNNSDNSPDLIYRRIYDGLYDFVHPGYIPQLVLTVARYQYQTAFVADVELQLLAFFVEIMSEGTWK